MGSGCWSEMEMSNGPRPVEYARPGDVPNFVILSLRNYDSGTYAGDYRAS